MKVRSAIRRTRSGTGARSWARRPVTPTRWRRSSGSCSPASRPGCGWRQRRRWSRSTSAPGAGPSWPRSSRSTSRRRAMRARASPSCRGWRRCRRPRLGAPEAAFVSYGLAIRDALGDPTLGGLLDSYERLAGTGPASSVRRDEVATLYRDITPDVLDEQLRLRLDRYVAESARAKGDHELAAEYFRRVLDRVPEDDTALGRARSDLQRRGRLHGALRDPDPPRRAGQGSRRRTAAARADRRAGREAARARRRGDQRPRARPGAGAARSRRHAGAGSPVHRVRALERPHALPVGDHRARPARARGGGDPLPPGADRARPPPRQGERARAAARRAARQPRAPGRGRDARGDARRHRRPGRGGRAAGAGLRGPRRLGRAHPRRRDPPDAGRGLDAAGGLDQAHRAPLRGAARGLRQRAPLVRQGLSGGADRAPVVGAAPAPRRQARPLEGRRLPVRRLPDRRARRQPRGPGDHPPRRRDLRPAARRPRRGAQVLPAPARDPA